MKIKQVYKKALNPNIDTTSKKNKMGEIINPTPEDIRKYNKKYTTVKPIIKSIPVPKGKSVPMPKVKSMPPKSGKMMPKRVPGEMPIVDPFKKRKKTKYQLI